MGVTSGFSVHFPDSDSWITFITVLDSYFNEATQVLSFWYMLVRLSHCQFCDEGMVNSTQSVNHLRFILPTSRSLLQDTLALTVIVMQVFR